MAETYNTEPNSYQPAQLSLSVEPINMNKMFVVRIQLICLL